MIKLIEFVGREKALNLYSETKKIQDEGGEKNEQFDGHKTPGGVFIGLIKKDGELNQV